MTPTPPSQVAAAESRPAVRRTPSPPAHASAPAHSASTLGPKPAAVQWASPLVRVSKLPACGEGGANAPPSPASHHHSQPAGLPVGGVASASSGLGATREGGFGPSSRVAGPSILKRPHGQPSSPRAPFSPTAGHLGPPGEGRPSGLPRGEPVDSTGPGLLGRPGSPPPQHTDHQSTVQPPTLQSTSAHNGAPPAASTTEASQPTLKMGVPPGPAPPPPLPGLPEPAAGAERGLPPGLSPGGHSPLGQPGPQPTDVHLDLRRLRTLGGLRAGLGG